MTDRELLQRYLAHRSEAAFRELTQRHLPMVYATALRKANGDAHLAHDIAQRAFVALFTKARSLSDRENLAGWLHTAANFEATRLVRSEIRRRKREEIADTMDDTKAASDSTEVWSRLAPAIDGVVSELPDKDRESVVLRFFSGKTYAQIGSIVGTTEESARKRVERALEKLKDGLNRRGIESTAAALGAALEAHAAAAPAAPSLQAGFADALWRDVSVSTAGKTGSLASGKFLAVALASVAVTTFVIATDFRRLNDARAAAWSAHAIAEQTAASEKSTASTLAADQAQARAVAAAVATARAGQAKASADLASAQEEAARLRFHLEHQRFYRAHHLSASQIGAFEDAWSTHYQVNLARLRQPEGFDPHTWVQQLAAAYNVFQSSANAILGPNGWSDYMAYDNQQMLYQFVDSIDSALPPGAPALTLSQADEIVAMALAASPNASNGKPNLPEAVKWNAVIGPAASVLDPAQLAILQSQADEQVANRKLKKLVPSSVGVSR